MINYTDMIKDIQATIKSDINAVNKWQNAGSEVRAFYGSETALNEVKAQFIADAIIPALDKKHGDALAKDLPRKGSKEYNDLAGNNPKYVDLWTSANQAKKDARAVAHTYFSRIVSYAFPKEKVQAEPRTLKTRLNEELSALIKACEKAEGAEFDLVAVIAKLNETLTVVNK